MHDTLADVLRGKVDHPVVGDFRLVAQEMGVAGRRMIESQALDEGWEHVKAEYEVDKAGGLDLVLAYSYFSAKNFGTERIDPLALKLANQHLENPISQGLFALTGPISKVPVAESEPESIPTETIPKETSKTVPDNLERLIKEKIGAAGDVNPDHIAKELAKLEELKNLGDIGSIVKQAIESSLPETKEIRKTSFDLLKEALDNETVTPRRLAKRVLKASRRILTLSESERLTNEKTKGDLIAAGTERLVKLDFARYLENLDLISEALAETLGEDATSEILTRNFGDVTFNESDEKTRKKVNWIYKMGMQRAVDLGNYPGMMSYLRNKWQLLGFDSDDISFVSNEFGKLMKRGRAKLALIELEKLNSSFGNNKFEVRIGIALQAFSNLSKAPVRDRDHFNAIFSAALKLFEELVSSIEKCEEDICNELLKSQPVADLCLASVTGVIRLMDSYIKRPGKSISAASVYPLLHKTIRPLITLALKTLKQNGDSKTIKSMKTTINKIRGESSIKEAMVIEAKSHFG
ncbi:MAG: hypothetical protein E3J86_08455 [Candidatus Thorarchaeota archaeon]|nr:MAG: hypothetical protein E3J86_08455 [Candidatus Thorarchaeota archaeon]